MSKTLAGMVLIAGMFLLIAGCGSKVATIDKAAFESIANGDSYESVVAKVGEPNATLAEVSMGDVESKTYQWVDHTQTHVIGFVDGKVVSKGFSVAQIP